MSLEEMRENAREIAKKLGVSQDQAFDLVERLYRHYERIRNEIQGKKMKDILNVIAMELAMIHASFWEVDELRRIYGKEILTIREVLRKMGRLNG